MTNTIKIDGSEIIIVRTQLRAGGVCFAAYEPSVGGYASSSHGSLYRIGDTVYGKIGTSRIPADLDAMPAGSHERYCAVHAFIRADKERAYAAILNACPEARSGSIDGMGEIALEAR